jgi:TonB family protein
MIRACPFFLLAMAFLSAGGAQQQSPPPTQQAPATTPSSTPPIVLAADSMPVIDALAGKLATEISNRHFTSVAVFGAMGPNDVRTLLGISIGDAFSDSLARQAKAFRVIDRSALRDELKKQRVAESMIGSNVLMRWMSAQVKADCIVLIRLEDFDSPNIAVGSYLFDPSNLATTSIASWRILLFLEPAEAEAIEKGITLATKDGTRLLDVTSSLPSAATPAGENGVGYPSCQHCPRPDYADEARTLKVQGDIWLTVVVTPQGDPTDIDITKGLGHGLDQKAVEALRKWKFKPAMDSSGKAVAAKTVVQMQFELFNSPLN